MEKAIPQQQTTKNVQNDEENHIENNDNNDNNIEHKRQVLLHILRQRGIVFDSDTGGIIDDKTTIETLLHILQNEKKKKEKHKVEQQSEVSLYRNTSSESAKPRIQLYESVNELCYLVYALNMIWLLFLDSNSFTGWFWRPLVHGLSQ